MAQYRGISTLTSGQMLAGRRVIDMSNEIGLLNPTAAPLTVLLKNTRKQETFSNKFEWIEDDTKTKWDKLNALYTIDDTTINVANRERFKIGDIVKNIVTKLAWRVDTSPTATGAGTVAVNGIDGFGETADIGGAVNDPLLIIGTAYQDAATYPGALNTTETTDFNYVQLFMTTVEVGQQTEMTKLYGAKAKAHLRNLKGIEHMSGIELAFWFGELEQQAADETPTNDVRGTRGVLEFLRANGQNSTVGTLTEAEFEKWLAKVFTYDSDTPRTVFASAIVMQALNAWGRDKIRLVPSDQTYGIQVSKYLSTLGDITIVPNHRTFEKDPDAAVTGYSGHAVALRLKDLAYKYLANGGDTKLIEDVKDDFYGTKDVYVTNCGLELKLVKMHGILDGVTGYI